MTPLWSSLWLSVQIATLATLLASLVAVPLAFVVARRRFFGKSILETLLTLPLVLPPTVVGYCILHFLGVRSPIGAWLLNTFDMRISFSLTGAILAGTTVALPLLYLPARAAFAGVDRELEDLSRLMGAGPLRIFWNVSLPLARRGIASGLLLAFARALGEFGATIIVFGSFPDRETLSISIYTASESGSAWPAVIILTLTSLMVIFLYNRLPVTRQD